jgi:hypothetical protein
MRKNYLWATSAVMLSFAVFMLGNANGPASNGNFATPAPGDGASKCSSCHTGGNFGSVQVSTEFLTDSSSFVSEYVPGEIYTININMSTTGGGASAYGVQMVSLVNENDGAINNFSEPSTGAKLTTGNSRQYLEHSTPNAQGFISVKWTAPAAGTGDVRFYYGAIATNGNGQNSGDQATSGSFLVTEVIGDTTDTSGNEWPQGIASYTAQSSILAYPNPAREWIHVSGLQPSAVVDVYSVSGALMLRETVDSGTLNVSSLPKGIYVISSGEHLTRFLKQ